METPSVLVEIDHGVGWMTLNRPRVLNSLDLDMVKIMYQYLEEWKDDPGVAMVCVQGAGEKGLCAGGDIRDLYDHRSTDIEERAESFFTTEYRMDYAFAHFPKPVLVYMDGVVMGGGVGLSVGASHRIVTEKTKWAMPEMNIGFFPDVGSSYFFNQSPGAMGEYLALTSAIMKAGDAIAFGYADHYIEQKDWDGLKQALCEKEWTGASAERDLNELVTTFAKTTYDPSALKEKKEKIDQHFSFPTVEEIIHSLDQSSGHANDWEEQTKKDLMAKSPTSLKVTLKQQQEAQQRSYTDCLRMELNLAMNFMNHDDFYEGVRAMLVDKDQSPRWSPSSLEKVSEEIVASFFHYEWLDGQHPLKDIETGKS